MIEDLRRTGLCRLGVVPWIEDFTRYLDGCEKFPGHVKARPRAGIECNSMQDVMAAPHFLQYARSFTPLASEYFGEKAHLWSLNAFYTDKRTPFVPGIHGLHRDMEAEKILCLFMFGTPAGPDGAQVIVPKGYADQWEAICGPAGTAWLADTTRPHFGLHTEAARMLVWARWAAPGVPLARFAEQLPEISP